MSGSRRRWFVLTVGRSGSSLLCAVLADAGADFGMSAPQTWQRDTGVLEHPAIIAAARHYRRAHDALAGGFVASPRLEAAWRRRRGRRWLRRALAAASWFKIGDLDLLVQPAFKLGYEPRVILSYRRFEPTAASLLAGRTHDGPEALARDYLRVYRQGLVLLAAFGGCVAGYEELAGGDAAPTLAALARAGSLDPARVAAAHARRVQAPPPAHAPAAPSPYPQTEAVFTALQELRGRVLEPGTAVARRLAGRAGQE